MKHMEDVQDEQAKTRAKRLDASLLVPKVPTPRALRYTEGETGISVYDPDKGTSTFQPYPKGYKPKPAGGSGAGGGSQPTQEELDEAEAAFNSPFRKEMAPIMSAFRTRGDKRPPQVLMLAAYRAVKARSGILETLGGARPLPRSASEADAEYQALNADVEARKNARKGGTSVTPVTPVTPSPAPQAPTPAPATISDAAYKQSQRAALWESIKASNPTLSDDDITAQVMRRIP
jgi:hypothetical protein